MVPTGGRRAKPERVVLAARGSRSRSSGGSGSNSGSRTAAPVALRRVTSGVTEVIFSAGLRSASDTSGDDHRRHRGGEQRPRSQIIGTTTAAATAASAEITSVWIEIPVFSLLPPL